MLGGILSRGILSGNFVRGDFVLIPTKKWPLAVLRDEGGNAHCSSCIMEMVHSPHKNPI